MAVMIQVVDTNGVTHISKRSETPLAQVEAAVRLVLEGGPGAGGYLTIPLDDRGDGKPHQRTFPRSSIFSVDIWEVS